MPEETPPQTEANTATAAKYRTLLRRLRFLPLTIILATVAIYVWLEHEATPTGLPKFVNEVEVTRPPSLTIDAGMLIGAGEEQDFYIAIKTRNSLEIKLPPIKNTLIGNGLSWEIEPPMPLNTVAELELRDRDLGSDDKLDRVTVNDNLLMVGQKYQFELKTENPTTPPPDLRVIWSIISGCGVLALVTAVFFIRDQAVD